MSFLMGYLDPGSGSMLLQLLVGGIAGAGVVSKYYGRSLLRMISLRPAVSGAQQMPQEPSSELAEPALQN